MRERKSNSSRSAYLFVTINLLLLSVFLVTGTVSLRDVNATLSTYDKFVRQWFMLRIAITESPPTGQMRVTDMLEYRAFHAMMHETISSAVLAAAGRLSDEFRVSVNRSTQRWDVLEAAWRTQAVASDFQIDLIAINAYQTALLASQLVLGEFVDTQERSLSVLLFCLGATVVLVIGVLAIVEVENQRARRSAHRVHLLAQSTLGIQERERARIAGELHDSLAQELSLATLESELLATAITKSDTDTRVVAERLINRLRTSISWVRNLAYKLRPAEIDNIGLAAAVTSYCEERAAEGSIPLTCNVSDSGAALPSELAIGVYRITQESVTNAVRHSSGTRIILDLQISDLQVALTVTDDGIGLARHYDRVNGIGQGLGLAGMRERARMLGGRLSVTSNHGRGTAIHLLVHLDHSRERKGER